LRVAPAEGPPAPAEGPIRIEGNTFYRVWFIIYFIPIDLVNTMRELKELLQTMNGQNGMFHNCYNACIYYFNTVQMIREKEKGEEEDGGGTTAGGEQVLYF